MNKRVVITGMGVISPVGNDVNTFWSNLCDGVCGIEAIKAFPTDNLPVGIAGIIKGFKAENTAWTNLSSESRICSPSTE